MESITFAAMVLVLGGFFGLCATAIGASYSLLKIGEIFRARRVEIIVDVLSRHCPDQHEKLGLESKFESMGERIDASREEFGHEIGNLKDLIIGNSPNGALRRLEAKLDRYLSAHGEAV